MRARRFYGQRKGRFSKPALTYLKRQFRFRYKNTTCRREQSRIFSNARRSDAGF